MNSSVMIGHSVSDLFPWWPAELAPDKLAKQALSTPYVVCDLNVVRERLRELQRALRFATCYYAVKSNSSNPILQVLADEGSGFDVASIYELRLLQEIGVDASRILYANPVKPAAHISAAYRAGVRRFVFDSVAELEKIARCAPRAEVLLRIAVDNGHSFFPLTGKFGAEPSSGDGLLLHARHLGLHAAGVTFHVGSQCTSPLGWRRAIGTAGEIMSRLEANGIRLDILDIGGGFPARYTTPIVPVGRIGDEVVRAIHELPYAPAEIAVEPGRFLVAESSVLGTTVIGRESRDGINWLYTDVGVYNGMMETSQGGGEWKHPLWTSRMDHEAVPHVPFTIAGPSCDSSDTMFHGALLPETMAEDDVIFIGSTGAYSLGYASNFNGFPAPVTAFVDGGCRTVAVDVADGSGRPHGVIKI